MAINYEELIIKVTSNSAQAVGELRNIDRSVQQVGTNAQKSAKQLATIGLALGGARGVIEIATKAIGSYIARIKESKDAYMDSLKDQDLYYNRAAQVIVELDKLREQAQINEGKRFAEQQKWWNEIQLKWLKTSELMKNNSDLMDYLTKQWAPFGSAARKEFATFQQFVDDFIQKTVGAGDAITDTFVTKASGAADALARTSLTIKQMSDIEAEQSKIQGEKADANAMYWAAEAAAMQARQDAINEASELEKTQLYAVNDVRNQIHDERMEAIEAEREAEIQAATDILSAWSSTLGAISNLVSNRYQAQIDAAEQGSDKQKELMRKQFNAEKALSLVQAAIATAVGITKAIPNIPLMAFAAASGALQTAAIAATKPPQFATGTPPGGYVVPPGYSDDSYPVMARSGERVTVEPAGGSGGAQTVILQLDGRVLGKAVTNLFDRRQAFVPAGAVV